MLRAGVSMTAARAGCEYREAEDGKYAHLVNPQCACGGLDVAGFIPRQLAWLKWRQHAGQV